MGLGGEQHSSKTLGVTEDSAVAGSSVSRIRDRGEYVAEREGFESRASGFGVLEWVLAGAFVDAAQGE